MAAKKTSASNIEARFLNYFVKLPKTFWGEKWAKKTVGAAYKTAYDVVELHTFKKGGKGHEDSFLFDYQDEHDFYLPVKELLEYNKKGLVTGWHFFSVELVWW